MHLSFPVFLTAMLAVSWILGHIFGAWIERRSHRRFCICWQCNRWRGHEFAKRPRNTAEARAELLDRVAPLREDVGNQTGAHGTP